MTAKKAAASGEKLVKVTAVHPYQISHDGKIAGPGDSLKVPEDVARKWEVAGLVTR